LRIHLQCFDAVSSNQYFPPLRIVVPLWSKLSNLHLIYFMLRQLHTLETGVSIAKSFTHWELAVEGLILIISATRKSVNI
jgi:hypothetical protein